MIFVFCAARIAALCWRKGPGRGPVRANPDPACHSTISQGGLAADVVERPASWFNTCAFAQPAAGQFGNAGRNILTGPGYQNINLSLVKNTALAERAALQFRIEAFNFLNHTNFDLPVIFFGSPTFGKIQSAQSPRRVQLGLKLVF